MKIGSSGTVLVYATDIENTIMVTFVAVSKMRHGIVIVADKLKFSKEDNQKMITEKPHTKKGTSVKIMKKTILKKTIGMSKNNAL